MSNKAFALTLQELREGRVHAEISQLFGELITQVQHTGKAGDITLKLKVKPMSRGDVDKVTISHTIATNLPKPERGEDVFYLTEDCELSRNHPRQSNLDLRDATPTAPVTLKEANNG